MKNITDKLKYDIINLNPTSILILNNISNELLLFAFEKDNSIIQYIAYKCPELCESLITQNPKLIKYFSKNSYFYNFGKEKLKLSSLQKLNISNKIIKYSIDSIYA